MLPPSSWKAATAARATSAAATAYSDSSRPVSSLQNFLITFVLLYACVPLLDGVRQRVDLVSDVATQQLEGGDGCQRDQRRGDRVLGQLKTCFVAKESLNHLFAPLELG